MRQAILDANANPGTDTIAFSIGSGAQTIASLSALPNITDPVVIDGATQPGFAGSPLIELSGVNGLGGTFGLQIFAPNCVVRGLVINRFRGALQLGGGSAVVEGNYLGTDITGTVAVGNTQSGLDINTADNTVGGTTPQARNIISGNSGAGIILHGSFSAVRNLIRGNYIGTDATGAIALGSQGDGVNIFCASDNTIGGTTAGARNVISGNDSAGVAIDSCYSTSGNKVQGNYIGLDATGTAPLGNHFGVSAGNGSTIGGTTAGADNVIAFNSNSGVVLFRGAGTAILGNAIFSNGSLGIDLGSDGVTPNDPGDSDTGPNNLQNFPVLTSFSSAGGSTTVQGTLNSTASTTFRVEFFASPACDSSSSGEGKRFLGAQSVTTDGSGNANFTSTLSPAAPAIEFITATATDPANNTSEFSKCVGAGADLAVSKMDSPDPVLVGQNLTYTITATNNGPSGATGVTVSDTLPSGVSFVSSSASQGSCSGTNTVTCNLGSLANGASATVTVVVQPTAPGRFSNTASVSGTEADPITANNSATAVTTVNNPGVTVTATDPNATEGVDPGVFTITRSGSTNALTVKFTVGGTATQGTDYNAIGTSVTIPSGQTSAMVTITPILDASVEGNETVILTLTAGAGYAVGSPSTATVTIVEGGTWASKTLMPTARLRLGVAAAPTGKLYAIGGTAGLGSASSILGTNQEYDPTTDTWTTKAPMPTGRGNMAVVVAPNGKIYAIGGNGNGGTVLSTVEEYDPATDTWTTKAPMPTARTWLGGGAAPNGKLYAIGGTTSVKSGSSAIRRVEEYTPPQ